MSLGPALNTRGGNLRRNGQRLCGGCAHYGRMSRRESTRGMRGSGIGTSAHGALMLMMRLAEKKNRVRMAK